MASPEQEPQQEAQQEAQQEPWPGDRPGRPRPEELLAKALESLEPDDRQRVTAWLLGRAPSRRTGWLSGQGVESLHSLLPTGQGFMELYSRGVLGSGVNVGQENQVVPVRLPTELHARLRTWSAANGFSMATVIRGLVSRFLDSQDEPAPEEPSAGS
jgi:hypothetical protein